MTDGLVLDIDLSDINEAVADLETFPLDLSRELTLAMNLSLEFVKGQVAVRTPVNAGTLRDSLNHQIVSPFPNLVGAVGSPLQYAETIEKGRRPGSKMPPVDAIALWAVRKLGLSPEEAEGAAWAIAKHIAKHGFSPRGEVGPTGKKMFKEGYEAATPHVNQLFDSAVARATARAND